MPWSSRIYQQHWWKVEGGSSTGWAQKSNRGVDHAASVHPRGNLELEYLTGLPMLWAKMGRTS